MLTKQQADMIKLLAGQLANAVRDDSWAGSQTPLEADFIRQRRREANSNLVNYIDSLTENDNAQT